MVRPIERKKRLTLDSIVVSGLAALLSLVACDSGPRTRPGLVDATTGTDGGPTLCEAAAECPTPENPCEVAACVGGVCASAVAPAGTFVRESAQVPGDCREFICGESGTLTTRAATDDLPEGDGNPCTNAACDGPNPSHVPAEVGTPCGEVGVCNGAGACGECLPGASDCVGDVPRVCDEDGAWAAGSPCPFLCEGEGVCGGTCRPGTRSCNGRQPRLCDDAGEWTDDGGQCEFACSDGACTGSCVPGALQCSGNVPEACSEAGAWVQNEPCPFACQGGQCTGLCAPGAKRCQGLGAQSCGPTGQWTTTNDCPYLCIDGDCAGTCSPGAKRCVGRTSQECDGAGQWVDSQTCAFACVSGLCSGVCQPGETRCNSNQSQVCDSQGLWQTNETCTFACLGTGTCGGVCTPGAARCNGSNAEVCGSNGQWTSTTCSFACQNGACTGICTPNEKRCNSNNSQTCNASGQWVTSQACPFVCSGAGSCTGQCAPTTSRCLGTTPQTCGAAGTWSSLTDCTFACVNGACTGVCRPGEKRCLGNASQTCDTTGQWTTTQTCPHLCSGAGTCTGVCTPGTTRCSGNTPQTCDQTGQWSGDTACSGGTPVCASGACTATPIVLLSRGKPASQSSAYYDPRRYLAGWAVDGDYTTFQSNCATGCTEAGWWQVDLGQSRTVTRVEVWNREDCCQDRVANFDIRGSTDGVNWVTLTTELGQAIRPSIYQVSGTARYVRVERRASLRDAPLNMGEVEVFGY